MSALPYMPLYVADYLADAAHLTTEEHGAYLLLIMTYWQRGKPLPADPDRLARIARLSNERWTDVERTLNDFFVVIDGHWHHKRINAELEKVRDKTEKAKRAGAASASARKATPVQQTLNGRSTDVQRTFNHTDTDTDTDKEDTSLRSVERVSAPPPAKPSSRSRGTRLSPDWQPTDADRQAALIEGMPANEVDRTAARIRDFWTSRAGATSVKLDWAATWRNWVRSDCEKRGWAPVANVATGPPGGVVPTGWRPGLPTDAELRAKYAKLQNPDLDEADHAPVH